MTDTNLPGFPGLDFEILIFYDFSGFPLPIRILYLYSFVFILFYSRLHSLSIYNNLIQTCKSDTYFVYCDKIFEFELNTYHNSLFRRAVEHDVTSLFRILDQNDGLSTGLLVKANNRMNKQ